MAQEPESRETWVAALHDRTGVPERLLGQADTPRLRDWFNRSADRLRAHVKIRVGAPLIVFGAALTALSIWGPGSLGVGFSGAVLGLGGLTVSAAGFKDLGLNEQVRDEIKEILRLEP